jgi:uracil-DNA glycosylase
MDDCLGEWRDFLKEELAAPYFEAITAKVLGERQTKSILPSADLVFASFKTCPLDKLRVIIIGQDPYPTKEHATGLAFSVPSDLRPLSKSLQNIFKELSEDLNRPIRENGDLIAWAKQGVLLLNTVLTIEEGKTNSHKQLGWQQFTDAVIQKIAQKKSSCVFILWGNSAQEKASLIKGNSSHLILKSPHPSPLSAYRGFFGSKPFSKTNEWLISQNKKPINW